MSVADFETPPSHLADTPKGRLVTAGVVVFVFGMIAAVMLPLVASYL